VPASTWRIFPTAAFKALWTALVSSDTPSPSYVSKSDKHSRRTGITFSPKILQTDEIPDRPILVLRLGPLKIFPVRVQQRRLPLIRCPLAHRESSLRRVHRPRNPLVNLRTTGKNRIPRTVRHGFLHAVQNDIFQHEPRASAPRRRVQWRNDDGRADICEGRVEKVGGADVAVLGCWICGVGSVAFFVFGEQAEPDVGVFDGDGFPGLEKVSDFT